MVAVTLATLLVVLTAQSLSAAEVTRRTILPGTVYATELIEIDSGVPGPTVWISGGVHGSELGGWKAAERIAGWRVSRGKLIVIPRANIRAVRQQSRVAEDGLDLNRQFPAKSGQQPRGTLATALWKELRRYRPDWVFDLHEALGNHNFSADSVGQTIIIYPRGQMPAVANAAIQRLNRGLTSSQKFHILRYPVEGSLAHAAGHVLGANASIIETSRTFALGQRINWHLQLMRIILDHLDMNPQTGAAVQQKATAA